MTHTHEVLPPTFCLICKSNIAEDRMLKRSVVCSDECAKARKRMLSALRDRRKCLICGKPSTPEERLQFQRWRRSQADYAPRKRGRPTKAKEVIA